MWGAAHMCSWICVRLGKLISLPAKPKAASCEAFRGVQGVLFGLATLLIERNGEEGYTSADRPCSSHRIIISCA